ncbi:CD109 antigen [Anopheles ziemanni]|uniref:CD109 antigen n=1 Tax=Anopheles coustani TaxID=139045 RepID=UPI00265A2817|nr:CD109 antigen [Anopheles coustani]XP_058166564.1 CD109 antigen [Anopheles ziemanni]
MKGTRHPTARSGARTLLCCLVLSQSLLLTLAQQLQPQSNDVNRYNPQDPFGSSRQQYNPQQYDPNSRTNQGLGSPTSGSNNPRDYYGNNQDTNSIDGNRVGLDGNRNVVFQTTTPRTYFNRQTSPRSRGGSSFNNPFVSDFAAGNQFSRGITYFIVASKMVRPGQVYKVSVSVLESHLALSVRASISRDGVELSSETKPITVGVPETLLMRVPPTSVVGEYKLRIEGSYDKNFGGYVFANETKLIFSQRSMTIFVQTDKPVYMQGELVRFRAIPITTELKGFDREMDVYMLDPAGHIMRRWLSRQSNQGSVSLQYQLADQPVFGAWKIRIEAQGQIEETQFQVEEYYQTRFEVNVTMPAFFFTTEEFIHGRIMANFTNGTPVKGNLTLKATIRPVGFFNPEAINQMNRVGNLGRLNNNNQENIPYYLLKSNPELYGNNNPQNSFTSQIGREQAGYDGTQDTRGGNYDGRFTSNSYQDSYVVERHLDFNEEWPFWIKKPIDTAEQWDSWTNTYREELPYLRFFNGTYHFRFPMRELARLVPNLSGMEILFTARVGERYYNEIVEGYAMTRVYNSSIRIAFLGDSPQVFKPSMPFSVFLIAEYHDGSPIPLDEFNAGRMEVSGTIESRASGGRSTLEPRILTMSQNPGVWEMKIDIRNDLRLENTKQTNEFLNEIQSMRLTANFIAPLDERSSYERGATPERASTELLLLSHFSPNNHNIKVYTSTTDAKVGEYITLHVQSNFYVKDFHYLVMSKGIILITGHENVEGGGVKTMSITLSAEMAPAATIVVWHIGRYGKLLSDSLTFPVNGISRNNFTVFINNRKARTGEKVEVAIYGEPGSYVGLSAIDNAFYTMQAGNELTYANVITKMLSFDEHTNGTFKKTWVSHNGDPDELVYYPASTFGIDANRTFEYAGLVVFTDGVVPMRPTLCDQSLNYSECLNGRCYRMDKRCDGYMDCEDGTDEAGCDARNETLLIEFRKYRFNRILRHYQNVWLWKDVNIGPHGRFIFNLEVPQVPALWSVSAFGISGTRGYGMIRRPLEYVGVQPFFINVEMPTVCHQGEQVGIRVAVFNYQTVDIEATVVLHSSPDYQFVHVEEDGIVRSYNPRTSYGEHQFYIYLNAQDSTNVYLPIVPSRLGEIEVTIHASTLLGAHQISRKILVEADGLVQHRHHSILLDLRTRPLLVQYMHVNVTETPIIPYEIDRYYVFGSNRARISVVGDSVGTIFPTMPVNASSLLTLPMDSAEQNMFSFAANFYTIKYMRASTLRDKRVERQAFHFMNILYQRQLSYLTESGAFSLFRSDWNQSAPSVWLTAYCAQVFGEVAGLYEYENFIFIDPYMIQKNMAWLLRHQKDDGSFWEVTWLPDRKANSSGFFSRNEAVREKNITLTAHVLLTLTTVNLPAGRLASRVALAQQRALQYLQRNLATIKEAGSPYEISIVAYALMIAKAPKAEAAFTMLAEKMRTIGEFNYWGNDEVPLPPTKLENQRYFSLPRLPYKYDSLNIQTTAYALLTYVSRQEIQVDPIVAWLNAQRLTDGGWASSQDTGLAMKALTEYSTRNRVANVTELAIEVEATSLPGETRKLHITRKTIGQGQYLEVPNAWGTVRVLATGTGYAILQMHVEYSVDTYKFQTEPPVPAFELTTSTLFHGRNQSHISYVICQRWIYTEESIRSGMAVLDVAVPTGYMIQQQKLDSYILSQRVRNLQRARFQERKVLFYFDYLDDEFVCVNFTLERWMPVANMSRYLPIRVYDYYAPERFNETIFDSLQTYLLNICEVCGSSQCPYCSIYNLAVRAPVSAVLMLLAGLAVIARHYRIVNPNSWIFWND